MKPNITNGAPSWIDDPRNVAQNAATSAGLQSRG